MNALKSTISNYVQNMTLMNMILMPYSDMSYLVASSDGYDASIQMLSRDKLKHQVSQQFLLRDTFTLSCDITFMSLWKLHHTITVKHVHDE